MLGRKSLPLLSAALRQGSLSSSPSSALRVVVSRAPLMSLSRGRCIHMSTPVLRAEKKEQAPKAAAEKLDPEEAKAREEMAKAPEFSVITGNLPPHIQEIADKIVGLSMLECAELTIYLKKKLGITDAMLSPGNMVAAQGGDGGGGGGDAGGGAAKEEPKKEKTEFTLKLESFNAPDKLKVIKEVRGITGLGLKESKEMVEGAPSVVKEGVSKEEGEKFLKALEGAGAKASLS